MAREAGKEGKKSGKTVDEVAIVCPQRSGQFPVTATKVNDQSAWNAAGRQDSGTRAGQVRGRALHQHPHRSTCHGQSVSLGRYQCRLIARRAGHASDLGQRPEYSNERARGELGWSPRPLEDSIAETGESRFEHGIVRP